MFRYHYHGIKSKFADPSVTIQPATFEKPPRKPRTSSLSKLNSNNNSSKKGLASTSKESNVLLVGPYQQTPLFSGSFDQELLSDMNPAEQLPNDKWFDMVTAKLPTMPLTNLPNNVESSVFVTFLQNYRFHCRLCLQITALGNFRQLADTIVVFWQGLQEDYRPLMDHEMIIRMVAEWDNILFQHIMSICIPDLLQEVDSAVMNKLQTFMKVAPSIVNSAAQSYPSELVNAKMKVVNDTVKLAEQYQSLNQLACQVAKLFETNQLPAMIDAWKNLDTENIVIHGFSVCMNIYDVLRVVHETVLHKLVDKEPNSRWAEWAFGMFEEFVPSEAPGAEDYIQMANQFLMRWSFINSLVMNDIKDRCSDEIFEMFHILRLFIEDYMRFVADCKYEEKKRMAEMSFMTAEWQPIENVVPLQLFQMNYQHFDDASLQQQNQPQHHLPPLQQQNYSYQIQQPIFGKESVLLMNEEHDAATGQDHAHLDNHGRHNVNNLSASQEDVMMYKEK